MLFTMEWGLIVMGADPIVIIVGIYLLLTAEKMV